MRTFLPSPWAWAVLGAVAAPAMRSARASSADSAKANDMVAARGRCEVAVRSAPGRPDSVGPCLGPAVAAERSSLLHHIFSPSPPRAPLRRTAASLAVDVGRGPRTYLALWRLSTNF